MTQRRRGTQRKAEKDEDRENREISAEPIQLGRCMNIFQKRKILQVCNAEGAEGRAAVETLVGTSGKASDKTSGRGLAVVWVAPFTGLCPPAACLPLAGGV